jgi:tRNA nucleotidyltransferase/poly(A) polymerase
MSARDVAAMIMSKLEASGHLALLAGGCVRDELLGREPDDYDVATDATPERITALFPRTAEVGAVFGVVLVRHGGFTVEVATFRADGKYSDARRPDAIRFSDPKEDALRRDYTVNALFQSPRKPDSAIFDTAECRATRDGAWVIDFVDGLKDLEAKIIRAVGDANQRLAEDHLRALRAARLAAKLGFEIESETAKAIRDHASELKGVSRERIGDEMRMMLSHPTRARAARLIVDLALLKPVLDVDVCREATTLSTLDDAAPFALALAAWMIDLGIATPDDVRRVRDRLLLSNDERDDVKFYLMGAEAVGRKWGSWSVAMKKRAAAGRHFAGVMALVRAADRQHAEGVAREVEALTRTPSGIAPVALLTGDMLAATGLKPGPMYKLILDAVYDAQLEDRVKSKEEAIAVARSMVSENRIL